MPAGEVATGLPVATGAGRPGRVPGSQSLSGQAEGSVGILLLRHPLTRGIRLLHAMPMVMTTILTEWRPAWSNDFVALAARIREAVGAEIVRVDHIGSTSVPGMAAKDCIDVQVIVRSLPN